MTIKRFNPRSARRLMTVAGLMVLLLPCAQVRAQDRPRVAILPFAVSGDPELGPVGAHIPDMLASRLDTRGKFSFSDTAVLGDTFSPEDLGLISSERALALMQRLGADYLVGGALRSRSGSISFETQVYGRDGVPAGDKVLVPVTRPSDALSALEPLADAVALQMTGSPSAPKAAPSPPGARRQSADHGSDAR